MSNTHDLYLRLKARGHTLHASGDKLIVRGPPLGDDDREAVKAAKPKLLTLLAAIASGGLPPEAILLRTWLDSGMIAGIGLPFSICPGRVVVDLELCVRSWLRDAEHGRGAVREAALGHVLTLHRALDPLISREATED